MSSLNQKEAEKVLVKKTLEETDEFEDFPVDSWPDNETVKEVIFNASNNTNSLWEEDWDDVEVDDDFTRKLKEELVQFKESRK
ncbi:proteasome regulatory particle lid subunit SEM1 SCDLUD_003208 [Saccharomycodes ludwigii]|uniref:proteasome regulatory particle lid subunit SEM1 n=1 Tax=Saccharomycodes ludwigii TaxID=36035 RepID=UPI001E82AA65|nr:hypothetical protein SCDLUD_003208 [Saccharomycodes ludwigii]KAH3900237.1 hypothetical protein SCDLUD_003208 [Saccharomycodes ludwigii]